jgi:hypothetical protein
MKVKAKNYIQCTAIHNVPMCESMCGI